MGLEFCQVVTIKDAIVEKSTLFYGEDKKAVGNKAKAFFLKQLKKTYAKLTESFTEEDFEAISDEGYFDAGCNSICLHWPTTQHL